MLTHVTVKNVFEDFIHDYDRKLRFKTPAFLGIDEIKIKKIGEVTVITDLEHRTLYDMLKGRNPEDPDRILHEHARPRKGPVGVLGHVPAVPEKHREGPCPTHAGQSTTSTSS